MAKTKISEKQKLLLPILVGVSILVFLSFSLTQSIHAAELPSTKPATENSGAKPVIKFVTTNGKVFYTDRETMGALHGKAEVLTGGQVLQDPVVVKAPEPASSAPRSAPNKEVTPSVASVAAGAIGEQIKLQEKFLRDAAKATAKSNCDSAKINLGFLSGRANKINENGEKEFLTDKQISQERQKLEEQISQNCS